MRGLNTVQQARCSNCKASALGRQIDSHGPMRIFLELLLAHRVPMKVII